MIQFYWRRGVENNTNTYINAHTNMKSKSCNRRNGLRKKRKCGRGLLDKIINKLPVELHIPGYQYCGPGTKLEKRLKRGDPGINKLDKACKEHDISYSVNKKGGLERHLADKKLAREAWKRVVSKDASLGERLSALATTGVMRTKMNLSKFGAGLKNKKKRRKKKGKKKALSHQTKGFQSLVSNARKAMKKRTSPAAIHAAIKSARSFKNQHNITHPRVIPIPKSGGALPLLPIFAGLSALGALSGGISSIVKTINDIKNARKMLEETKRHNTKMEGVAVGSGLFLKPFKKGYGLYLNPYQKNF